MMKKLRERIIKFSVISLILSSHTWASAQLGDKDLQSFAERHIPQVDLTFKITSKKFGEEVFLGMDNRGQLFKSTQTTPEEQTIWKHVEGSNSGNIQHVQTGKFLDMEITVCAVGVGRNNYWRFRNLTEEDQGYIFLSVFDIWRGSEFFCLDFERLNQMMYETRRDPKTNPGKRLKLTFLNKGKSLPFSVPFKNCDRFSDIERSIVNLYMYESGVNSQIYELALSTGQFGKAYALGKNEMQGDVETYSQNLISSFSTRLCTSVSFIDAYSMGQYDLQRALRKDIAISEAKKTIKSLVRQQVYLQDVSATSELTQLMEGFVDTPVYAELQTYLETNRAKAQQLYSGFLANPQIQAITPEVKNMMLRQLFADMN